MFHIATYLHEAFCARLGNGTKIVDEIRFGHTNTTITDGKGLGILVGDDLNEELFSSLELFRIGKRLVSNFIESIRSIGDQFTKEDFLVGIESVCGEVSTLLWLVPLTRVCRRTDDQVQELADLSLEAKAF